MSSDILIRGVNWVGDAVMTMPAIRALRRSMPGSRMSLLVKEWVSPLFSGYPHVDDVITYEDSHKGLSGRLGLASALKKKHFSRAILLPNSFDSALVAFLARIPERTGYSRDMRGLLLTQRISYHGEDRLMHHIDYYIELLNRAGIPAERTDPWIYLTLDERLEGRETLGRLKRPLVGINPGAAYGSAKQWLPDRFAQVAERVITELDGSVVIFGGPSETGIAGEISEGLKGHVTAGRLLVMAGKTTLRGLAALISECDMLLTNDSGPMHIGYAVNTPLVALFGSTDPSLTGPPENGNIVIKKDMPCSPCFLRKCKYPDIRCMEAIESSEVFEAIRRLLPTRKAVFFDRDGTLCVDSGYLNNRKDFKVFNEVISISTLINKDFAVIGVTNQSGIARGFVEEGFVREVNRYFMEKHGFEDFYHCPHHPDEHCPCRKPEPGMLTRARLEHGVNLRRSYVVGDKDSDMLLARAAGAKGVLVLTGKQKGSEFAHLTARDLGEATRMITADV